MAVEPGLETTAKAPFERETRLLFLQNIPGLTADIWESAFRLEPSNRVPLLLFGFIGNSGAGKTTSPNSLLGIEEFLPTA